MTYVGLGSKVSTAVKDPTGLNPGNWTNVFDVSVLGAKVSRYEVESITVRNIPGGLATVTVYVGTRVRSSALLGGNSEWDPSQPIRLTYSDDLYICWNAPASGTPPEATVWLRYDPAAQPTRLPQPGAPQ